MDKIIVSVFVEAYKKVYLANMYTSDYTEPIQALQVKHVQKN